MPVKRKCQSRTATGIKSTKASKACLWFATCKRSLIMYAAANRRRGGEIIQITKAPHHGEKPVYARKRAAPERIAFRLDSTSEPARLYVPFTHRVSLLELIPQEYVGRADLRDPSQSTLRISAEGSHAQRTRAHASRRLKGKLRRADGTARAKCVGALQQAQGNCRRCRH